MVDCFECRIKLGWNSPKINGKKMKEVQQLVKFSDNVLDRMNDKDVLCGDCNDKFGKRHALELYNYDKNTLSEKEWENYLKMPETKVIVQEAERILTEQHSTSTTSPTGGALPSTTSPTGGALPSTTSPTGGALPSTNSAVPKSTSNTTSSNQSNMATISADQLRALTSSRHDEFKAQWDKNGLVQFKNDKIVILKRMVGQQVQFIVAYDKITEEGYRLMAIDEGMTAQGSGFSGGASAYFYFQKMDYVR